MASILNIFTVVICSGISIVGAEICYAKESQFAAVYGALEYTTISSYCSSNQYCCGGTYFATCCTNYYDSVYTYGNSIFTSVGTIAGVVVGGLVGLGVLIVIIVACVCVRRRRTRRPGQVFNSGQAATTFTVAPQPGTYPTQATYPQNAQYPPQNPRSYNNPTYTPDGQYVAGANPPMTAPPSYDTAPRF